MNYDIIPRTSLHNGYKLFQEARVIDDFVVWGKREVLRKLGQTESESQVAGLKVVKGDLSPRLLEKPPSTLNPKPPTSPNPKP